MGRPPCDKLNAMREPWTTEEDAKILAYVSKHVVGDCISLGSKKAGGVNRCDKNSRLGWTNYLRPDGFTPPEEELIINLHKVIGSRWSLIAKLLPGRTYYDVKKCWNTKLSKKLSKMGIDPVSHKPFSQILSEHRNNSAILHIGASNATIMSEPEPTCSVLTELSSKLPNPVMESNNPSWDFFGEATSSCSSASTTASS